MRSVTSCFDKTIIRTDVRRYWPLLFFYTGIWTIMLPVVQWVESGLRYGNTNYYPGDYLYDMMFAGMIMALIFCGLFAMAQFSYLMNSRSVGLMHSLPATRGTQFMSHVAAGMGMLTAGKLLVALLTIGEQLMHGQVALKAICVWFLVVTLVELFFFALAILCCMVTGWLLAMPVLYAAANCVVIIVTELLRILGGLFYFGYTDGGSYPAITRWLTPVYTLSEVLGDSVYATEPQAVEDMVSSYAVGVDYVVDYARGPRVLDPDAVSVLAIYTVLAVAMLVVAYVLYTKRASESAGDPVAFSWARPIVRCAAALLGGLALGLGLYSILSVNNDALSLPLLVVCMVLMGLLCYFAVEMVIRKSFRVFRRSWRGAVAISVVLVAVLVAAKLDITGYETRVPDPERVTVAEINLGNENVYVDECVQQETIDAVVALHAAIVAEGEEPTGEDNWYNIHVAYKLKDGTTMRRRYYISLEKARQSERLLSALNAVINAEEVRYKSTLGGYAKAGKELVMRGGYITGKLIDYNNQLSAEDAQRIYDAVMADLAAGAGGHEAMAKEYIPNCAVYVELDTGDNYVWLENITPDFTETVAVLIDLGLDSETLFLVEDEYYAEKYGW